MTDTVHPFDLTWRDVDPRQHPFDAATALDVISSLAPARFPATPDEGDEWTAEMVRAVVDRFGRWAAGWRWAHNEGDLGGGPVTSWCCARHSITTPDATLHRIADALCRWRSWLEDLAERFDRYPLDTVEGEEQRQIRERATTHLVTAVVDRTGAGDAWYRHAEQVLSWFLTRWGTDPATAADQVERAVSGDFASWTAPETQVLDDVAGRLAEPWPPRGRG
ncbi:hypothetical protein ACIA5G_46620 [Amycolatopsis sp. NPDC051758]|uniref:hypothetical protein n=1 Tax=Amycolatopsis sp. NPDC051758 TaxID=3363935 RepID=UPI00379B10E7